MTIISASRRTDIPALYGAWFMDKIAKGACLVKNPYSGKAETVSLKVEDVDGIVFWSRNYAPMIKNLKHLRDAGYRFYMQYTLNAYPKFIDPGSPPLPKAAKTAQEIAKTFGARALVWRYDPIMLTSETDVNWHLQNFGEILKRMEGATDTCVISFIDRYRKLERNLFPLLENHGVEYMSPDMAQLVDLAETMAQMAKERGIKVESCCEPGLMTENVGQTSCIDTQRLMDISGASFEGVKRAPTRKGCRCFISKDIGAYDTCTLGCAYCYANRSRDRSEENRRGIKSGFEALAPDFQSGVFT